MLMAVSALTFALLDLAPGDAAVRIATRQGGAGPPDLSRIEAVRQDLGLDDAWLTRYLRWLGGAVRGDFGRSFVDGDPVNDRVWSALGPTVLLTSAGLVATLALALPLGSIVGLWPGSIAARAIRTVTAASFVVPGFLVALGGLWLFAVALDWFPSGGMSGPGEPRTVGTVLYHLALPALVLSVAGNLGTYVRVLGASVAEVAGAEHVRCATARGVAPLRRAWSHVVRNSLIPLVAQIGASISYLVGGAYAVEVVYGWPGLGRVAVAAARDQDPPLILAIVALSGVLVVAGNLVADLALGALDPRASSGRARQARRFTARRELRRA